MSSKGAGHDLDEYALREERPLSLQRWKRGKSSTLFRTLRSFSARIASNAATANRATEGRVELPGGPFSSLVRRSFAARTVRWFPLGALEMSFESAQLSTAAAASTLSSDGSLQFIQRQGRWTHICFDEAQSTTELAAPDKAVLEFSPDMLARPSSRSQSDRAVPPKSVLERLFPYREYSAVSRDDTFRQEALMEKEKEWREAALSSGSVDTLLEELLEEKDEGEIDVVDAALDDFFGRNSGPTSVTATGSAAERAMRRTTGEARPDKKEQQFRKEGGGGHVPLDEETLFRLKPRDETDDDGGRRSSVRMKSGSSSTSVAATAFHSRNDFQNTAICEALEGSAFVFAVPCALLRYVILRQLILDVALAETLELRALSRMNRLKQRRLEKRLFAISSRPPTALSTWKGLALLHSAIEGGRRKRERRSEQKINEEGVLRTPAQSIGRGSMRDVESVLPSLQSSPSFSSFSSPRPSVAEGNGTHERKERKRRWRSSKSERLQRKTFAESGAQESQLEPLLSVEDRAVEVGFRDSEGFGRESDWERRRSSFFPRLPRGTVSSVIEAFFFRSSLSRPGSISNESAAAGEAVPLIEPVIAPPSFSFRESNGGDREMKGVASTTAGSLLEDGEGRQGIEAALYAEARQPRPSVYERSGVSVLLPAEGGRDGEMKKRMGGNGEEMKRTKKKSFFRSLLDRSRGTGDEGERGRSREADNDAKASFNAFHEGASAMDDGDDEHWNVLPAAVWRVHDTATAIIASIGASDDGSELFEAGEIVDWKWRQQRIFCLADHLRLLSVGSRSPSSLAKLLQRKGSLAFLARWHFKPSLLKGQPELAFVPVNCHSHRLHLVRSEANGEEGKEDIDAVRLFEVTTSGAWAAHPVGFRNGGWLIQEEAIRKLAKKVKSSSRQSTKLPMELFGGVVHEAAHQTIGESLAQNFREIEEDLWLRRWIVLSQALTTLVTAFASHLEAISDGEEGCEQLRSCGFLFVVTSLLSVWGKEFGMLSDVEGAVRALENVVIFVHEATSSKEETEGELKERQENENGEEDEEEEEEKKGDGEERTEPLRESIVVENVSIRGDCDVGHLHSRVRGSLEVHLHIRVKGEERISGWIWKKKGTPLSVAVRPCLFARGVNEQQALSFAVAKKVALETFRRINSSGFRSLRSFFDLFRLQKRTKREKEGERKKEGRIERDEERRKAGGLESLSRLSLSAETDGDGRERESEREERTTKNEEREDEKREGIEREERGKREEEGVSSPFSFDSVEKERERAAAAVIEAVEKAVKTDAANSMELFQTVFDAVRLLQGSLCVMCKSAKDRTSMLVTALQARRLCSLGLPLSVEVLQNSFRAKGVRMDNVVMNLGAVGYAFNDIQRLFLPSELRPPPSLCRGGQQT